MNLSLMVSGLFSIILFISMIAILLTPFGSVPMNELIIYIITFNFVIVTLIISIILLFNSVSTKEELY